MANLVTIGLAKIEIGAIAGDGDMGTSLAVVGYTAEGGATWNTEDPTETEIKVEEVDTPIYISTEPGKSTLTFSLASPDLDQCAAVFGGTVSGSGTAKTWDYPDAVVVLEKSVKITPKVGLVFKIPRASLSAKFSGSFARADTLKIEIVLTVLQPTKSGVKPMKLSLVTGEA